MPNFHVFSSTKELRGVGINVEARKLSLGNFI